MWILTSKKTGVIYYMLPEKSKHLVGRANADLILKDDTSISRSHACLYPEQDHVKLIDTGSKYGTFCNENIENEIKLEKNTKIELKNGERVQFGILGNEWTLSKLNICTLISAINGERKEELQKYLDSLGGHMTETWMDSCTHLTMSEITVTLKVLRALVENIPIVSCEYWKDYYKNIQNGKPPPICDEYLPKLAEKFLNKDIVSFTLNDKRKTIFQGKTFIFMDKTLLDKYSSIIQCAGGECKNLNKGIQKSFLLKKDVIVIQHVSSSQSQSSQSINVIEDCIRRSGNRLIPDFEIGLAIIYCSTEKYCNPKYNITSDLLPNSMNSGSYNVLAVETPLENGKSEVIESMVSIELPESVVYVPAKAPLTAPSSTANESIESEFSKDIESEFSKDIEIEEMMGKLNDKEIVEKQLVNLNVQEDTNSNKGTKRKRPSIEENIAHASKIPNRNEESQSSLANPKASQRSSQMIRFDNFLDKSQIRRPDGDEKESAGNEPTTSSSLQQKINPRKRGKIATITDNDDDSDDDNDLFNFGRTNTKRLKQSSRSEHSEDEHENNLFNFVNKKINENRNQPSSSSAIRKTNEGRTVQTRNSLLNQLRPSSSGNISVQNPKRPEFVNCSGWLSKSMNKMEIKSEDHEDKDKTTTDYGKGEKNSDWISSLKGGFEVRVKPLQLVSRSLAKTVNEPAERTSNDNTNENMNTTKKNFKAFVKKRNYKPQREIVPTVSFRVMCDLAI